MRERITHQTQRRVIKEKGKRRQKRIIGFVIVVCAMVLAFAPIAAAEDSFRICVNGTTNSDVNINFVLYGEPNDAEDSLFDVDGTGSFSGIGDLIVTDLTNSNPEARYKLQGTAQIVPYE